MTNVSLGPAMFSWGIPHTETESRVNTPFPFFFCHVYIHKKNLSLHICLWRFANWDFLFHFQDWAGTQGFSSFSSTLPYPVPFRFLTTKSFLQHFEFWSLFHGSPVEVTFGYWNTLRMLRRSRVDKNFLVKGQTGEAGNTEEEERNQSELRRETEHCPALSQRPVVALESNLLSVRSSVEPHSPSSRL